MQEQNTTSQQSSGFDISHYVRLFNRKKWYIISIGTILSALWAVMIFQLNLFQPILEATALLGSDDPTNMSAVSESAGILTMESKVGLIKSRSFLNRIVDKLTLQLQVKNVFRKDLFSKIELDSNIILGQYNFDLNHEVFNIYYTNKKLEIDNRLVYTNSLENLNTFEIEGARITLSDKFINEPYHFTFYLTRVRDVVDVLLLNLTVRPADFRRTLLQIKLTGKDYHLITDIVNTLADEFTKFNLAFIKRKTSEVLIILNNQLERAQTNMDESQQKLQKFRERNSWVGLRHDATSIVNDLTTIESNIYNQKFIFEEATNFTLEYSRHNAQNLTILIKEMISFLVSHNDATAPAYETEINSILIERRSMESLYAPEHPLMAENTRKIQSLGREVYETLINFINRLKSNIDQNQTKIKKQNYRLNSLPSKELQLAYLQRRAQVNSEIYQTILIRYNESKIANATEVGDIYVMDYAVVPEVPSGPIPFLKRFILGVVMAFGSVVGLFLITDFFDKRVRNEVDLQRMVDIPVVETIPVIKLKSGDGKFILDKKKIDPMMITSDYTQDIVNESFRSLRSKILIDGDSQENQILAFSSLLSNEGKSLITSNLAITFAQRKMSTLLIDGDMRRGVLHHSFVLNKKRGLSDILFSSEDLSLDRVLKICQSTHVPNLEILTCGTMIPNPTELIGSEKFRQLMHIVKNYFDIIIFDTPPIGIVSDALSLTEFVDRFYIVVKAGQTNVDVLNKKLDSLLKFKSKTFGFILNFIELKDKKIKDSYSYYHY